MDLLKKLGGWIWGCFHSGSSSGSDSSCNDGDHDDGDDGYHMLLVTETNQSSVINVSLSAFNAIA